MIGHFLSLVDITVGLDGLKKVVGSFKYLTRMMMSSGLWNYLRIYQFRLSLNFLY